MEPTSVGKYGELLAYKRLKKLSTKVQSQVPIYHGALTRTGKAACYKIDFVTDEGVWEIKTAKGSGSPEKLGDAVHRLGINGEKLGKQAFLVVNGAPLEHHVKNDPAFLRALSQEPRVTVLTFKEFNQ
jgi:hypothetical protein